MTSAAKLKSRKGLWLFVAPVRGLALEPAVNRELRVNNVTFIDRKRLPYVRKRLGFPYTIRELERATRHIGFFSEERTYAVCRLGGSGAEKEREFLELVREELNILSLSQLGFGRRRNYACLSLAKERPVGTLRYFMTETKGSGWSINNSVSGRHMTLRLGPAWLRFQRHAYFFTLLEVIRGRKALSKGWERDIKNASILAGRSQSSEELEQAFLWNMIAIETLLTHRGDPYSSALPKRVEAFLGWSTNWPNQNYEEKIADVYQKRCALVHAGQSKTLTVEDLLFTDNLLLNVFHNIVNNLEIFRSKEDLVEFSRKVEAEHLLGQTSRVRPSTLSFIEIKYSDRDYETV